MAEFGEELSRDQVITSKLLKLVNSAYYGFPGRVSTVTQALVLLGIDAVKGLIVTSNVFDGLTPEALPLWRHSLLTSLCARMIATKISFPDVEEVTVGGLLHDIGKVVLYIEEPEIYREVIKKSLEDEVPLHLVEKEVLGFDHSEVGVWMCEEWTLPGKLMIPIGFHHAVGLAKQYQDRTAIVAAANAFVKGLGAVAEVGMPCWELEEIVQKYVHLDSKQISEIIDRLEPEKYSLEDLRPSDLR